MKPRKVCVVVASRANYGRVKYLMKAIESHPKLELQLIVGASTLLERFGKAVDVIKEDGFVPVRSIHYVVEGETLVTQAKSTGLGIVELSTAFQDLRPDMVVTVADRFETLSTAVAASYLNIPLVHVQGGEVSGNIDDRVRHAITKLSDYHFTCTQQSYQRVLNLGEESQRVFNFGCPAMDTIAHEDMSITNQMMSAYGGVGDDIDWEKPYLLIVQHPVTTSFGQGYSQVEKTLLAMLEFNEHQKIMLWPNPDAGSDDVSKAIRVFREAGKARNFRFFRNFAPEDYARVLFNAKCCVGNSSSFIREGSFSGVPAVIVGDRQNNREVGKNVIHCNYDTSEIVKAVRRQLAIGKYERDPLFGNGNAGHLIAEKLAGLDLSAQKRITY